MTLSTPQKSVLIIVPLLVLGYAAQAQKDQNPARIDTGSPLPVHVTNTPALPEGFAPGTRWRFTTWTSPSVLTWIASVNRTSGPWAHLTVRAEDGSTTSRWYYIPAMPGGWEQQ